MSLMCPIAGFACSFGVCTVSKNPCARKGCNRHPASCQRECAQNARGFSGELLLLHALLLRKPWYFFAKGRKGRPCAGKGRVGRGRSAETANRMGHMRDLGAMLDSWLKHRVRSVYDVHARGYLVLGVLGWRAMSAPGSADPWILRSVVWGIVIL